MDDNNTLRGTVSNTSKEQEEKILLARANTVESIIGMPPPPSAPLPRREVVRIYIRSIIIGFIMLTFIIFGIFSIYWGALYRVPTAAHKLTGWVVDFDQGPVGNYVMSAVRAVPPAPTTLNWVIKDASEFPGGPADLIARIHDQDVFYAVSVNPGASDALAAAFASPQENSNYDGSIAVTGYGEEARNENGFKGIFKPQLDALMMPITAKYAAEFVSTNFSSLSPEQAAAVVQFAPQLMNRPINYKLNNLIPFNVPVAPAMTLVGMILLLVMSFMAAMVSLGAREMSGLERRLPTAKLIALRFLTDFIAYFFLSLFYCLISLAFQAPFNRHFGGGGFMAYWMLQWIGMLALGYALETMITLLTPRFMPLFLLLWIVSDVSVSLFPIEALPNIYRYGYAMPFYNISQGIRTIVFGTKNHLGLNFGVLFAWIGVSAITMPLATIFVRWNRERLTAKNEAKLAALHAENQARRLRESQQPQPSGSQQV